MNSSQEGPKARLHQSRPLGEGAEAKDISLQDARKDLRPRVDLVPRDGFFYTKTRLPFLERHFYPTGGSSRVYGYATSRYACVPKALDGRAPEEIIAHGAHQKAFGAQLRRVVGNVRR